MAKVVNKIMVKYVELTCIRQLQQ